MSFADFMVLLDILRTPKVQTIMQYVETGSSSSSNNNKLKKLRDELMVSVPLQQWVSKLETIDEKTCIEDVS